MPGDRQDSRGPFNGDPEPVEMMEDDDDSTSSNDSDNDEMKSENSEIALVTTTIKEESNDTNNEVFSNGFGGGDGGGGTRSSLNDTNNNNKGIVNSNGIKQEVNLETSDPHNISTTNPDLTDLPEEDQERKRFQIELEFVQSLANPNYLNFLAQRGYFRNPTFLNYLNYLSYWKKPEYVKYIMYPQCLSLLELLQHETFQKEIVNAQCSKYIDEQLLLIWLHYKKRRDWVRLDPAKVPEGIEKLFASVGANENEIIIKNTKKTIVEMSPPDSLINEVIGDKDVLVNNEDEDAFGAEAFLKCEKF